MIQTGKKLRYLVSEGDQSEIQFISKQTKLFGFLQGFMITMQRTQSVVFNCIVSYAEEAINRSLE